MQTLRLILIGLATGIMSGIFGVGGGSLVIPALILIYGLNQHTAQGTSLAMMIPPISLLAAWHYWKNGNVNVSWAALLCLGFLFGGLIGAYLANIIPDIQLRRIFGLYLLVISIRMILWN